MIVIKGTPEQRAAFAVAGASLEALGAAVKREGDTILLDVLGVPIDKRGEVLTILAGLPWAPAELRKDHPTAASGA